MREILFRGKRKDNGEWACGCYYKQSEFYGDEVDAHIIITSHEDLSYDQALNCYEVDPETVGQFTGQLAQDVRIFEGDIFRYGDEVYAVKWDSGSAKFYCYCLDGSGWICDFLEIRWEVAEVIGNIHDNPELLEV